MLTIVQGAEISLSVYDEVSSVDAQWLKGRASELEGCIQQSHNMRLMAGKILSEVRARFSGQFDRWLQEHWPQMSRSKVARLMAVWNHRERLGPFMDEPGDEATNFQTSGNGEVSWGAVERIAEDGAKEDLIQEVLARVQQGLSVGERDVQAIKRSLRKTATKAPKPVELLALALWLKQELEAAEAALNIARAIVSVSDAEVRNEVGLRELPKGKVLQGITADFHRLPDGNWARIPHKGRVDAEPVATQSTSQTELIPVEGGKELVTRAEAAARMGFKSTHDLTNRLTPSKVKRGGLPVANGWEASPATYGRCYVRRVA